MKRFSAFMICALLSFTSLAAHPCEAQTNKDVGLTASVSETVTVEVSACEFTAVASVADVSFEMQTFAIAQTFTVSDLFVLSDFRHSGHERLCNQSNLSFNYVSDQISRFKFPLRYPLKSPKSIPYSKK